MKRIKVGDLVVSDVCPELIDIGTKIGTKSLVGHRFIKCMGIRFESANFCRFYGRIN